MKITWYEMKKALKSPIVLLLLFACIALNSFHIISQSHAKEEINLVNELIHTYGRTITDESLIKLREDLDEDTKKLGNSSGIEEFLNEMEYEDYEELSSAKKKEVNRLQMYYTYYIIGINVEESYTRINMDELRSELLTLTNEDTWFMHFMDDEFTKWEERYEEIIASNEYKQWYFAGDYHIHSEMYRTLLKNIAIQSILISVLMTALVTNYEVEQRTHLLMYSTRKGRSLMKHKFIASILLTTLTFFLLVLATYSLYFSIYNFSGIWPSVVSSGVNWEYKLPYITWWELPVWQFFLLALSVEWAVVVLVTMLAFSLSCWTKNSYFTWILILALLISLYLLPSAFNAFPFLQFVTSLNLTLLLLNPHMYFTGGTTFTMVQWFEVWSLAIWGTLAITSSIVSNRYFMKKDVK